MKYIRVGEGKGKPLSQGYGPKKKCSRCDREKSVKAFYRRGGTGLLQSRCIVCTKKAAVESKERVQTATRQLSSGRFIEV